MANEFSTRIVEKCCIVNNDIWYANLLLNGLFKVDILTGKVFYAGTPDKKECCLRKAYSEILYYKGFLYMVPFNAAAIGIYDILTGAFDNIPVPEKVKGKFYEAVLLAGKIYLLPHKAKRFYCLDIKTKKLSEIRGLRDIKVSILSSVEKDGEIWFLEDEGHGLYCYQPINKKYKRIILDKTKGCFRSIGKVGKWIVATAVDKAVILSIDPKTQDVIYFEFEKYLNTKGINSYFITEYQNKALLVRTYTNDCVIIDIFKRKVTENPLPLDLLSAYGRIWKTEQGLVRLPIIKSKAFRFLDGRTIFMDDEDALLDWKKTNNFHWERCSPMPDYDIETLIQVITGRSAVKSEKGKQYGNTIYKMVKGGIMYGSKR